MNETEVLIL
ncbi:unnamed protein product, partial [Brachionus calyciflorus]